MYRGGYTRIADIEGVQKMLEKGKHSQIFLQDYNLVELLNKCENALLGQHYSIITA